MRRTFVFGILAVLTGLAACERQQPPRDHVLIRIVPSGDGFDIRLDDESVPLDQLDAVVLSKAIAENPGMTVDEARRSVLIAVGTTGASAAAVSEVGHALRGFERIVYIAEDRRA